MLTTDTEKLRQAIGEIEAGRRAMMDAPSSHFDWNKARYPTCKTPGCCIGFMYAESSLSSGVIHPVGYFKRFCRRINLPEGWGLYVFAMSGVPLPSLIPRFWHDIYPRPSQGRDLAAKRMEKLANRLRRRLAVLEVEQGEWGRSLPARDMPVGAERERMLSEREEATTGK